jgi:hypothetical protein
MSIDATLPTGTMLVSQIDDYIREDRLQINLLWDAITAANSTETAHLMGAGDFSMAVGSDLEDVIIEGIVLTGNALGNDLRQITGGSGGMLKVIKAGDANVTVKHDAGYIDLTGDVDYALSDGSILGLINVGGTTGVNGVWYELFRGGATGGGAGDYTAVNMTAGQTSLITGTDVTDVGVETIGLTADAAVNLTTITLANSGSIKHIVALDDDITAVNGIVNPIVAGVGGILYLNAPVGVDFDMDTGDVLSLVNIGGDGVTVSGYWMELNRKLQV